jgi:hypothetical protein
VRAGLHQGPEPSYGFFGRDLDILRIEKRLLTVSNLLPVAAGLDRLGHATFIRAVAGYPPLD